MGGPSHEIGDVESHCDGSSNNDHYEVIILDNHSHKSTWTISKRGKYNTRTAQAGATTNKSQDHRVAFVISYDGTPSDENEKMEAIQSYVLGLATFSVLWTFFLVPYWILHCSDTTLNISKFWVDVLGIGFMFLIITAGLVAAHALQFKDGKLPDSAGFKLLQIVQGVVVMCLWVGIVLPLRVCRCMPNWVVWTCAAVALFIIVISWSLVFQQKKLIMWIKTQIKYMRASSQMFIDWTKFMYDKVQQWLPNVSLPEFVKAQGKSDSGMPMERV